MSVHRYIVTRYGYEYIEDAYSAADALTQFRTREQIGASGAALGIKVAPYQPRETLCKYQINRARQPPGRVCCCYPEKPDEIGTPHTHFDVDQRQPDGVECTCREACKDTRWAPHVHDGARSRFREPQP